MHHDDRSIRDLLATYEKLLNASDAAMIAALYTADGIFMPQGFPTAAGQDAVLQSYRAIFANITLSIAFDIDDIVVGDGIATALTRSSGSVRINASDDEGPESNRELFVLAQEAGVWRIARYMFNKAA